MCCDGKSISHCDLTSHRATVTDCLSLAGIDLVSIIVAAEDVDLRLIVVH